jgi:TolB-like protein/tetratricopeptide (TPR) repeat protein
MFQRPLRVRFGQFEMDEGTRELCKDGIKIRLQEQPLQILQALLEHSGEIVTREELRKRVWPTDTFVDFDHGINNAIKRLRQALGDTTETPRYIETLPRRGYRFVERVETGEDSVRSLAVLPLENLSHDPEQEYFADGLTDSLITQLARISALRVVSRTTAMHYKRIHRPLPEIARELGVSKIVEGTVQRSGGRVRICAQLVEASTDTHLWADSYERDLRDVLSLQSEVVRAIVKEVQIKLTPQEQAHLARANRVDPEAYDAYLRGRYYVQRRGDALRKGVQCFEHAIERDPTYAAAYAGLADCLSLLGWWAFVPPLEGCGRAKEVALKALQLDESLGEAHASLAWATVHYDYDFALAEKEYRTSIELNSRYATGHQWFGLYLTMIGRHEEGFQELKTGIRLDPFVPIINACLAWGYWLARRQDDHIEQLEKTLELDPNFAPVNWGLGLGYLEKGMYGPAIAAMEKSVQLSQRAPIFVSLLGEAYAVAGRREDAQKIVAELKETAKQRYVTPYILARIYAALNEKDKAFRLLEKAYREHAAWTAFMKSDPRLDNLRSDPRFGDLLRLMNFPE